MEEARFDVKFVSKIIVIAFAMACLFETASLAESASGYGVVRQCPAPTDSVYAEAPAGALFSGAGGSDPAPFSLRKFYWDDRAAPKDRGALEQWVAARADQGDAKAQFALGREHETSGRGEYDEASKWYRAAAGQNYAPAEIGLGRIFAGGLGISRDEAEGFRWYCRAATQGESEGMFAVVDALASGSGVRKDTAEALVWYRKAAEKGLGKAREALGIWYATGRGGAIDQVEAAHWFCEADRFADAAWCKLLVANAQFRRGREYDRRNDDFSDDGKNDERAVYWYRRAAENGDVYAQVALGETYAQGLLTPKDAVKAAQWFRSAADGGSIEAARYYRLASDIEARASKSGLAPLMYTDSGPKLERPSCIPERGPR
jgi:TPR repeat protein